MTEKIATEPEWRNLKDLWLNAGTKAAAVYHLIEGKFIAVTNRRKDIDSASIPGHGGVECVLDTTLTEKRFEWTHSDFLLDPSMPTTESLDYEQNQPKIQEIAGKIPATCYAEGDELMEGVRGTSNPYARHLTTYYKERIRLRQKAGVPIRMFLTYGSWAVWNGDDWETKTGDGSQKQPNHPLFKAMVASPQSARRGVDYFNVFEPIGAGFFIKHYADRGNYANKYYNKAFAAERMCLGLGLERGMWSLRGAYIDWGKIEGLGGETVAFDHGLFFVVRDTPQGEVRNQQHPQVDYDWQVGNIFGIAFCRLGGYVGFDERDKYGSDPNSRDYPPTPLQWHDAALHAGHYYNQCDRTAGKPWQYARYKVKGTDTWFEPKGDGTEILEHASAHDGAYANFPGARRGEADCMFRVDGNALDIWGFDPSRSCETVETIIANPLPGIYVELPLAGSKLLLKNITL